MAALDARGPPRPVSRTLSTSASCHGSAVTGLAVLPACGAVAIAQGTAGLELVCVDPGPRHSAVGAKPTRVRTAGDLVSICSVAHVSMAGLERQRYCDSVEVGSEDFVAAADPLGPGLWLLHARRARATREVIMGSPRRLLQAGAADGPFGGGGVGLEAPQRVVAVAGALLVADSIHGSRLRYVDLAAQTVRTLQTDAAPGVYSAELSLLAVAWCAVGSAVVALGATADEAQALVAAPTPRSHGQEREVALLQPGPTRGCAVSGLGVTDRRFQAACAVGTSAADDDAAVVLLSHVGVHSRAASPTPLGGAETPLALSAAQAIHFRSSSVGSAAAEGPMQRSEQLRELRRSTPRARSPGMTPGLSRTVSAPRPHGYAGHDSKAQASPAHDVTVQPLRVGALCRSSAAAVVGITHAADATALVPGEDAWSPRLAPFAPLVAALADGCVVLLWADRPLARHLIPPTCACLPLPRPGRAHDCSPPPRPMATARSPSPSAPAPAHEHGATTPLLWWLEAVGTVGSPRPTSDGAVVTRRDLLMAGYRRFAPGRLLLPLPASVAGSARRWLQSAFSPPDHGDHHAVAVHLLEAVVAFEPLLMRCFTFACDSSNPGTRRMQGPLDAFGPRAGARAGVGLGGWRLLFARGIPLGHLATPAVLRRTFDDALRGPLLEGAAAGAVPWDTDGAGLHFFAFVEAVLRLAFAVVPPHAVGDPGDAEALLVAQARAFIAVLWQAAPPIPWHSAADSRRPMCPPSKAALGDAALLLQGTSPLPHDSRSPAPVPSLSACDGACAVSAVWQHHGGVAMWGAPGQETPAGRRTEAAAGVGPCMAVAAFTCVRCPLTSRPTVLPALAVDGRLWLRAAHPSTAGDRAAVLVVCVEALLAVPWDGAPASAVTATAQGCVPGRHASYHAVPLAVQWSDVAGTEIRLAVRFHLELPRGEGAERPLQLQLKCAVHAECPPPSLGSTTKDKPVVRCVETGRRTIALQIGTPPDGASSDGIHGRAVFL